MRKINIKGWTIEVLPEYLTEQRLSDLESLIANQVYNMNTNWENYRKVGQKWKRKTS